jgi:hypothetical protein
LTDRFEFSVIEHSTSQAVLLLEAPLMAIGNFTFACKGGYQTRVTVETPDALSENTQNFVFKLKEVRFNSSSFSIGLHSLLPFVVLECNDCNAHICTWTINSGGSYANLSSGSFWSTVIGSQACQVPNIEVFGFYQLQIYGSDFASSSTDIYIIPFVAASSKVLQNCKAHDVTFELETSYSFDLDLGRVCVLSFWVRYNKR